MTVAVLGAGIIGRKLIEALVRHNFSVVAYNRSHDKLRDLQVSGVRIAATAQEAIEQADCILLVLSDKKAVDEVLSGSKMTWNSKVFIQMGTIAPVESRELARMFEQAGGRYAECPILGSRKEIENGTLILMYAGSVDILEEFRSVFRCFGPDPQVFEDIGQAAAIKLAMNNLIAMHAIAFSTSLGIIERNKIDSNLFMRILKDSSLHTPMFDKKLSNWQSRKFDDPNFPTKHLLKDVLLIHDHLRRLGMNDDVSGGVKSVIENAVANGCAELDYSSLINVIHPKDYDKS